MAVRSKHDATLMVQVVEQYRGWKPSLPARGDRSRATRRNATAIRGWPVSGPTHQLPGAEPPSPPEEDWWASEEGPHDGASRAPLVERWESNGSHHALRGSDRAVRQAAPNACVSQSAARSLPVRIGSLPRDRTSHLPVPVARTPGARGSGRRVAKSAPAAVLRETTSIHSLVAAARRPVGVGRDCSDHAGGVRALPDGIVGSIGTS